MLQFLADAGIVPSRTKTYTLAEIEDALAKGHGSDVTVRCHGHSLNEIWYHFNVAGTLQTGYFVPSSPGRLTSMFIRASTNPSGRRSEVQLPCKGCPLPTQEISPSKPDPYGNGTRKANRYSWYPIPRRGQLESLDSGSGTRLHHQLWHLVYFRDLCDFQRRKSQRSVPLSRNNLMSRIQHTDSSFTDNTFTLTSSRGKCSFEQDILTCGAHIDNPMEFEVSSVFFPSHLSAYSYKNR